MEECHVCGAEVDVGHDGQCCDRDPCNWAYDDMCDPDTMSYPQTCGQCKNLCVCCHDTLPSRVTRVLIGATADGDAVFQIGPCLYEVVKGAKIECAIRCGRFKWREKK